MEVSGKKGLDSDIVTEPCEPCQADKVSTQADGYCNECEEYMCKTCFQRHLNLKLCRNHVLGAIDAGQTQIKQKQEDKCKKHTSEVIKYFCRNHYSVACGDCIVEFHRNCETKFIRDLVNNIEDSSDFKDILEEVDNLKDFKSKIEMALERNKNKNTELHDKAIKGIQQSRTEINTWLNNVTLEIEAEEMDVWKENEILLSKLEDWIKTVSDMIDKATDEISIQKYNGEHVFIRVINCKSKIGEFARSIVPEIKTRLEINSFTFEPNQSLLALTKSEKLGVIKVRRNGDEQTGKPEKQTGHEAGNAGAGERDRDNNSQDHLRTELKEEKEKNEKMRQYYETLKKELEMEVSSLRREKEKQDKFNLRTKNHEKQEIRSLKWELGSRNMEYQKLESQYKARYERDQKMIKSLQAELKNQSETHEKERKSLVSLISDLKSQRGSAEMSYQLPDPRAAGFDVGKRVKDIILLTKGRTGKVTAVVTSGYVDVEWDSGHYGRYAAGAGGQFDVELEQMYTRCKDQSTR